jgi:hypothetical protein
VVSDDYFSAFGEWFTAMISRVYARSGVLRKSGAAKLVAARKQPSVVAGRESTKEFGVMAKLLTPTVLRNPTDEQTFPIWFQSLRFGSTFTKTKHRRPSSALTGHQDRRDEKQGLTTTNQKKGAAQRCNS